MPHFYFKFFCNNKFFNFRLRISKRFLRKIIIIFSIIFACSTFTQFYFRYEKGLLLDFINTFFVHRDLVYKRYFNDYRSLVDKYFNFDINKFKFKNVENLPDVYFIHLESVNGYLKDRSIIPNFDSYSYKYGVGFDNFYSNSTQTLLAQESILCALPPSLNGYFRYKFDPKKLICIPKILSKNNYITLFFKSHSLEFSQTGDFMSDIGFREVHNQDIMNSQDIFYKWGFREDVFYRRVYEYINKYRDQKKFVYIAVSTTNHYPFIVQDKSENLPIKNANFISDRIKNTVYIQDKYLLNILEELKKDNREKYVFLFSDHSWPLNFHVGNILNQSRGYKENFYIPFAFLYFGEMGENLKIGDTVSNSHNQVDFLKTTLDLLNIETNNNYLGNSFYCELFKNSKDCKINNCSMSVQQYSDKYITFFLESKHYIYNVKKKQAYYFDLFSDPHEKNQKNITQSEFLEFYEKCKNLIGY